MLLVEYQCGVHVARFYPRFRFTVNHDANRVLLGYGTSEGRRMEQDVRGGRRVWGRR